MTDTVFSPISQVCTRGLTLVKKTSLHLISAVSADITSGITSNITSAAGQKPKDFLFVCFTYLHIVAGPVLISTLFTKPNIFQPKEGKVG